MARVLAGRTFAGRPRGHLPALVCQSGARVENWRLHIQLAEAVYRPAAAVYRSAAEKGVDASTAVYGYSIVFNDVEQCSTSLHTSGEWP